MKALVRLCESALSPEPTLLAYAIKASISHVGSFVLKRKIFCPQQYELLDMSRDM